VRFCSQCGAALETPPPTLCAACGAEHWRNPKPAAGAIVQDEHGRILLVRRGRPPWEGSWDVPEGFCNHDEPPDQCARRKVAEETGLEIEITGMLGCWVARYDPDQHEEDATWCLSLYFLARIARDTGTRATPSHHDDEVYGVEWFAHDALPDDLAFPHHAKEVLATWRQREYPDVRVPDPAAPTLSFHNRA
jgi:ADP-ribose pyrophosphatase YjhB (NUDIX family)